MLWVNAGTFNVIKFTKCYRLSNILQSVNPDIVFGTDTWLDGNIEDQEIFLKGYKVYRKDRPTSGGGVRFSIKDEFKIIHIRLSDILGEPTRKATTLDPLLTNQGEQALRVDILPGIHIMILYLLRWTPNQTSIHKYHGLYLYIKKQTGERLKKAQRCLMKALHLFTPLIQQR